MDNTGTRIEKSLDSKIISKWAFILLGKDKSGKTTFQKCLAKYICERPPRPMKRNRLYPIKHRDMPEKFRTIFFMNRSFHEKTIEIGETVEGFFKMFNEDINHADISILSSHVGNNRIGSYEDDVSDMIEELKYRAYNVAGVFFSNSFNDEAKGISLLPWDNRIWFNNQSVEPDEIEPQIDKIAADFSKMLVARAAQW